MNPALKPLFDLREKRDRLLREAKAIHEAAGDRDLTHSEGRRWDDLMKEVDGLSRKIDNWRSEVVSLETGPVGDNAALETRTGDLTVRMEREEDPGYRGAFTDWLRGGRRALSGHDVAVMERRAATLPPEVRALATSGEFGGGYLIPFSVYKRVFETLRDYSGMRSAATILRTETGDPLGIPVVDDSNATGAILDELEAIPDTDITFQQVVMRSFTYTSGLVLVSLQLAMDSAIDLPSYLAGALGRRVARKLNADFTTGSGEGEPLGLVADGGIEEGVADVSALTDVDYATLLELSHSVDPAYRQNAVWMANDEAIHQLRGLVDGNDRPLWDPMREGRSDLLLGRRVVLNNDLPEDRPIVFGDIRSAYMIRDVGTPMFIRFQERYMDRLALGFAYVGRHDGRVVDKTAAKYLSLTTD